MVVLGLIVLSLPFGLQLPLPGGAGNHILCFTSAVLAPSQKRAEFSAADACSSVRLFREMENVLSPSGMQGKLGKRHFD